MSYHQIIFLEFIILSFLISFSIELRDLRINEEEEQNEKKSKINPPKFSKISGFYSKNFHLILFSEDNYTIYYTIDSSDPRTSQNAKKFKDYIFIYDKSSDPNIYSSIGGEISRPDSIFFLFYYIQPFYAVDKAMIIRAVTKNSEGEFSEVITKTYFVTNEDLHKYQNLTVISLVTNPENLFDPDTGIYITGNKYLEELKKSNETYETFNHEKSSANFLMKGKEWERESFITFFDKGEIKVQQNVGIRIKGNYTRRFPAKSFNIYAREKYGKSMIETDILTDNYDINGNLITSYKALSLRAIYDQHRLRDKFGRDLFYVREGITTLNMRNVMLFLNGEYWGLYIIQEKIDKNFISQNYLLSKDKIIIGKNDQYEDGPEEQFKDFQYFCGNYSEKDVSNEKIYTEIKNYIDIDSFAELFATSIYIQNIDWPGTNDGEWKYLDEPIEGNKYTDGKWRFILFDLDYSMEYPNFNSFIVIGKNTEYAYVRLFLNLIKNNINFKIKFVNTICDYANNIYDKESINQLVEKYKEELTDAVAYSQLRWFSEYYNSVFEGYSCYKKSYYKALKRLQNFFEKRPLFLYRQMKEYIGLRGKIVNLTLEIKGGGKIQVNSIIPKFKNGVWTGKYFTKIPINIKAIPDAGYTFKGWSGYIQSNHQNDEIVLNESSTIICIFE